MSKHSLSILIGLWCGLSSTVFSQIIEQDSLALVALYNATNGSTWNNNTNWLQGPVATWHGVGVNLAGTRVDTLALDNNGLTGVIPDAIGSLTSLKELYLQNAGLSGPLPVSIGNLSDLHRLYIYGDNIRGNIPTQFGSLGNLRTLAITSTKLSGRVPDQIGNLQRLEFFLLVSNDSLEGPLPESILRLPRLRLMAVMFNSGLTGSVLTSAISEAVDLEQIELNNSGFQGAIPPALAQLNELGRLGLEFNDFDELPDLTASSLSSVSVQNNRLTFEDIERNLALRSPGKTFNYAPQKPVYHAETITARAGSRVVIKGETGGSANSYQWFKNGAPEAGTAANLTIEDVSATHVGSYSSVITSAIVTDLTLQRSPVQLTVVANEPISFCQQVTLDATRDNTTATYLWSTGETTPVITVTKPGNYTVTVETDDYTIVETHTTQPDTPDLVSGVDIRFSVAAAGQTTSPDQVFLTNGPLQLINTSQRGTGFTWNFGDGTTTGEEDPSHTFLNPGTYVLQLTGFDEKGCGTAYQHTIEVQELFVTNAITPNDDGANDQLFVEPFLYPASLRILNRWGQEVFYSSDYQNDFTGAELTSGVYFFELKIADAHKDITGSLTILKKKVDN